MKKDDEKIKKLEQAVKKTYMNQQAREAPESWSSRLMFQIKREKQDEKLFYESMSRSVWRFAYIAATAAVVLTILVARTGFTPETEIAQAFLEDPAGFTTSPAMFF